MPNYSRNAKSLIYGLSDFWTLYFQDIATIEEIYRGVEVDVGQVYLDLLSMLLNNSVQDATLFNKEYFRLLRFREDAVTYSSDGKYRVLFGSDVAGVKYLHNKVFNVTAGFEDGIDFQYDEDARAALFDYDPLNAYTAYTFGTGNGSFRVRTRTPNVPVTLTLLDTGVLSPTVTLTDTVITVSYDGPGNTSTGTAAAIVSALNSHPLASQRVLAELAGLGTGSATLAATSALLLPQEVSPVERFAARTFDVEFGTKFVDPSVSTWASSGVVRKGDVLRILKSPKYGSPLEFPIALVREGALYLYPEAAPETLSKLDYRILRSPKDDTVEDEPLAPYGLGGSIGTVTVDAATRTLISAFPLFPPGTEGVIGSAVRLEGVYNAGEYRVTAVVSPTTLEVTGPPMVDELLVPTTVLFNFSSYGNDATITDNGDGTGTLTAATLTTTPISVGGVLTLYLAGQIRYYAVTSVVNATTITFAAPDTVPVGVGVTYALDEYRNAPFSLFLSQNSANILPGSVSLTGRRQLDGAALEEGRDYDVDVDLGIITPKTVWRTDFTGRASYRFRDVLHAPASIGTATTGTLSGTGPYTLSDPTLALLPLRAGMRVALTNTAGNLNDGTYYVEAVTSATSVVLSSDNTPTLPESSNGFLVSEFFEAGQADVSDTTTKVTEIGVWAVDALVDRYHLYFTFGYLIDKASVSSEAYRSLIRGLFQLFMLGPTLERFESAINTVATLPVIRDDGEVLLSYSNGASQSGIDGVFDGLNRHFTSATAAFTQESVNSQLFAASGYNVGRTFTIETVLSANEIILAELPTSDTAVSWELTATGTHSITTSRTTYTLPRSIGVKGKYTTPANWGVLSLRAFEVISSAFTVTDYVETPRWWEDARIPHVLLPDYEAARRQSTPVLFENIIDPADDARVGDPGLFVDADDEGNIISRPSILSGVGGVLYGDPLYPTRNTEVFFEAPTLALTGDDRGNYIQFDYPHAGVEYRIVTIISPTRAKVEAYYAAPPNGTTPGPWNKLAGILPMRHTAAYLILDRFLKHHLFFVAFDAALFQLIDVDLVGDLNTYVFEAKPTYTYLVLSPYTLLNDVITAEEDAVEVGVTYQLSGRGGDIVQANDNPLRVDGTWTVGSWFRYRDLVSTFVTPAASVPDLIGVPAAGYRHRIHQLYIDPTTFLDASGAPIPMDGPVTSTLDSGTGTGSITALGSSDTVTFDCGVPGTFEPWMYLYYVTIDAPAVNAGTYRIGNVIDDQTVAVYAPGASLEAGLDWSLKTVGFGFDAVTSTNAQGETFITDTTGRHDFTLAPAGTYVRRYVTTANQQRGWRVDEAITPAIARLAERESILAPGATETASAVTAANEVTIPGFIFSHEMTYNFRLADDYATSKRRQYYIEFLSGPNTGEVREILQYVSPNTVIVDGAALTADLLVTATLFYREHYVLISENGPWEHLSRDVYVDNASTGLGDLTINVPVAAGVAAYDAHGIQEPEAPFTVLFDDANGDTYYTVDGLSPVTRYARPRTGHDMDHSEGPVEITVTP
jgi:hypothetical protein